MQEKKQWKSELWIPGVILWLTAPFFSMIFQMAGWLMGGVLGCVLLAAAAPRLRSIVFLSTVVLQVLYLFVYVMTFIGD